MLQVIDWLNGYVWSYGLIILSLSVGLYFTIASRFLQLRYLKHMVVLLLGSASKETNKGISSFQALAVSVAGRVGTGNIAGVATAIGAGGPGALFWMWLIAFLGAATSFIECSLGQLYKIDDDGEYRGGPAFYIEKGMGNKAYALVFALAALLAMGILGPAIQSNSIVTSFGEAFPLPPFLILGVVILGLALIIFGGIHRIGHVAEWVIPFMAVGYISVALIVIGMNIDLLPGIFAQIIDGAFGMDASLGGILGATITWGVKRGLYSNEAGQGSGPHAAAAAEVKHPAQQGFVQALSVYIDTLFICTATGLIILITKSYNVIDETGNVLINNLPGVSAGPAFTQVAIDSAFSGFGGPFVAISLFFFAFTTLLTYYYIAETNLAYLFKGKPHSTLFQVLRVLLIVSVAYGGLNSSESAWALGDLGIGINAWLNMIALLFMSKQGLKILADYDKQYAEKDLAEITLDPKHFGLPEDSVWCRNAEQD